LPLSIAPRERDWGEAERIVLLRILGGSFPKTFSKKTLVFFASFVVEDLPDLSVLFGYNGRCFKYDEETY
jgi:hypothetical protein